MFTYTKKKDSQFILNMVTLYSFSFDKFIYSKLPIKFL